MEALVITLLILLTLHGVHAAAQYGAIYQFGDSISDTGNDVRVAGANIGCDKSPYGETFFKQPTGRCSNGLLMVDYFAQSFKIPFLSPYLNNSGDFTHGANFAVSGATALTTSGTSLLNQLGWFKTHLATICHNKAECKQKLRNALFLVGEIGGNDYNSAGFKGNIKPVELQGLAAKVIQTISDVVKQLIDIGATRLIVPGNFPVGCMTIYLAAYKTSDPTKYDELGCLKDWNDLAAYHNGQLQMAIRTLQTQHPNVKIVYADYFSALKSVFQNAASLGFDTDGIHKTCCGTGDNEYNFDGGRICGSPGVTSCPDPNVRVSWDGIHLTQHAYQVMADQLLKQFRTALS